jgi:CRISPR-associated protein Csm2
MGTTFNKVDGVQRITDWVQNGISQEAIEYAKSFGEDLYKNRLSTSQIRNVFSEIKSLQMKGEKGFTEMPLLLLKPKLAYAKARKTGGGRDAAEAAGDLEKVLSKGIDAIVTGDKNKYEKFENFANLFEAILAYHRSFGGK